MNECIIYYDGFNHCNDPVFVTKRALKTTLLVTEQHKKRKTDTFFNYGLCQTVELRTRRKYSVTENVTATNTAAKVKESVKSKAEYQQIYFSFVEMDLIASRLKLLKEPKNADKTCVTSNRYYRR